MPPFDCRFGEVHFRDERTFTPEERMARLEREIAECDEGTFNARYDKLYKTNNRGAMRAREELMKLRAQYGYGRRQEFRVGYEDDDCRAGCPVYDQRNQDCYECYGYEQNYMARYPQDDEYRAARQMMNDLNNPVHRGQVPQARANFAMLGEENRAVKRGEWESEGVPVYGISHGPHDGKVHGSSKVNTNAGPHRPDDSSHRAGRTTHRVLLNPKDHKDEDDSSEGKPKKKAHKTSEDKPLEKPRDNPHDKPHDKVPKIAHDKAHGQAHGTPSTSHGTPHGPNKAKSTTEAQNHHHRKVHES